MIKGLHRMMLFLFISFLNSCIFMDIDQDSEYLSQDFSNCLPEFTDQTFEIISWNIERFPSSDDAFHLLEDVIPQMEFDLLAVQEINQIDLFKKIISGNPTLDLYLPKTSDLNIGFIYNKEVLEISSSGLVFEDEKYLFPRPVIHIKVKSIFEDTTWHFFSLHLKCCGGKENRLRRTKALNLLKDYLDQNFPDDPLMVVGDFNENVPTSETGSLYQFISDHNNYFLADFYIGMNSQADWSYPSYPGHLDHILTSDEFRDNFIKFQTITIDYCIEEYKERLSDHRPVYAQFRF